MWCIYFPNAFNSLGGLYVFKLQRVFVFFCSLQHQMLVFDLNTILGYRIGLFGERVLWNNFRLEIIHSVGG